MMIIPTQAHQVSELHIFTLRLKGEHERFVLFLAVTLGNAVFDLFLCSVVEIYLHFGGACCLHPSGRAFLWNISKFVQIKR